MENTAIALIIVTNIVLVIILGLLAFLVYRLLKQKLPDQNQSEKTPATPGMHPEILKRMKDMEKVKSKKADLFCPNHPEEPDETVCAICDQIFCKSCIKPFKSFHACKEHLPLLMANEWEEILTLKTSTHDPEQGVRLYDVKKDLFSNQEIPTYIETHYKINVDQDYIETYLVMYGISGEVDKVKEKLQDFIK